MLSAILVVYFGTIYLLGYFFEKKSSASSVLEEKRGVRERTVRWFLLCSRTVSTSTEQKDQ